MRPNRVVLSLVRSLTLLFTALAQVVVELEGPLQYLGLRSV
jgi:hypothetical protein